MRKKTEELSVGKDFDIHIEWKNRKDGKIVMNATLDPKTPEVKKFFEKHPKFFTRVLASCMPPGETQKNFMKKWKLKKKELFPLPKPDPNDKDNELESGKQLK